MGYENATICINGHVIELFKRTTILFQMWETNYLRMYTLW